MVGHSSLDAIIKDRSIVGEFLSALTDSHTYRIWRNGYVIFGVLWGLPVPVVTVGLELLLRDLPPTPANAFTVMLQHPIQLVFLLHPLLFGVLFGAMGTVRYRKVQRIHALVRDLEANLRETQALNEQLREADTLKDEFLGTISHELKTPLVTARGYTEMLLHGRAGALDDHQKRIVQLMLKNIDRQIQLISDLLDYVRIGAHPYGREPQEFDLRQLIRQARDGFAPSLEKKELRFEIALPDEPLPVYADPSKIEIVLSNLLSNAIKFTDKGGTVRIESRRAPDGRVVTWVSDTGCGIAPESLPHIFERFRQGDGSTRRRYPGTGLGLAIVKKILDSYGCAIEVESSPGEGTSFCFDLPVKPRQSEGAALDATPAEAAICAIRVARASRP